MGFQGVLRVSNSRLGGAQFLPGCGSGRTCISPAQISGIKEIRARNLIFKGERRLERLPSAAAGIVRLES